MFVLRGMVFRIVVLGRVWRVLSLFFIVWDFVRIFFVLFMEIIMIIFFW